MTARCRCSGVNEDRQKHRIEDANVSGDLGDAHIQQRDSELGGEVDEVGRDEQFEGLYQEKGQQGT